MYCRVGGGGLVAGALGWSVDVVGRRGWCFFFQLIVIAEEGRRRKKGYEVDRDRDFFKNELVAYNPSFSAHNLMKPKK